MDRVRRAAPLLALIRAHEASPSAQRAQGVSSAYDVVWGRIKPQDRPRSRITQLTVDRVLWWQDAIDKAYMSEAAGAYQFMEDTLRTLKFDGSRLFDAGMQDELALQLLDRRGWARCESGELTPTMFGDQLAKEWASFPVMTGSKKGRSYYAGDGLNKASASPDEVLTAIHAALGAKSEPPPPAEVWTDREVAFLHDLMAWANKAPIEGDTSGLVEWRKVMPNPGA